MAACPQFIHLAYNGRDTRGSLHSHFSLIKKPPFSSVVRFTTRRGNTHTFATVWYQE